jgi:hypothetical protein
MTILHVDTAFDSSIEAWELPHMQNLPNDARFSRRMNDGRFCDGSSGDWQQFRSVAGAGHRWVTRISAAGLIAVVVAIAAGWL